MLILLYVAFCTIMAISRQKEARSRDYSLLLSNGFKSAQYHRQHCTLQAFKQFGALYMHNPDDKYPTRPGCEPSTSEFQATTESNEPYCQRYPSLKCDGLGPGAVVKAACLKSRPSQVRTPLWPISLIQLTILKRFSWPGLAYICTKMA